MNRVLWTIIGAIALAAGLLGFLAGVGALPNVDKQDPVLTQGMIDAWNRNRTAALTLTIVAGAVLALLGIFLMRAMLRRRGGTLMRDIYLQQPEADQSAPAQLPGSTEVASRALHDALQEDLETDRQVRRAAVRLTGPTDHPQLLVRLAVTADADIARLAGHLDKAVDRFIATSGVRPELSDVVVRMPVRTGARSGDGTSHGIPQ
jgi:hypothetical protein